MMMKMEIEIENRIEVLCIVHMIVKFGKRVENVLDVDLASQKYTNTQIMTSSIEKL